MSDDRKRTISEQVWFTLYLCAGAAFLLLFPMGLWQHQWVKIAIGAIGLPLAILFGVLAFQAETRATAASPTVT